MKNNNKILLNRIFICLSINILLLLLLYNLPLETNHSLCIYKNCGMTRAFLSILHLQFKQAMNYNWKVVIIFPYVVIVYVITWYKYIFKTINLNETKKRLNKSSSKLN